MIVGGPIVYNSKSRTTITHSILEAEFATVIDCAKTVLYLRNILEDIGTPSENATIIYKDNVAAIEMSNV